GSASGSSGYEDVESGSTERNPAVVVLSSARFRRTCGGGGPLPLRSREAAEDLQPCGVLLCLRQRLTSLQRGGVGLDLDEEAIRPGLGAGARLDLREVDASVDRKSTRLNS